ncbi:Lrp/AsnC ligand binding domain-containing protein [Nonomuraea cavernae]|nr:Lrp/AsnC ligand binding domain-containing protein [Nonomuraea cavernae]MCA2189430.1 Lrp/AsnC ligand binding domain-containing protein [Nonomuraea cavernae]
MAQWSDRSPGRRSSVEAHLRFGDPDFLLHVVVADLAA